MGGAHLIGTGEVGKAEWERKKMNGEKDGGKERLKLE